MSLWPLDDDEDAIEQLYAYNSEQLEGGDWDVALINARRCVPAVLDGIAPIFGRLAVLSILQTLVYRCCESQNNFHTT